MTPALSREMEAVVASLAGPGTLIVLDFDGTLAPIVGDRRDAGLTRRTRAILHRLARLYPVAILSGRGAEDVRSKLDGADVRWVVGSHGAEWPGEGREHHAWRSLVGSWRAALAGRLAELEGVELELKPLSLAVHYRHCRDQRAALARISSAIHDLPGAVVVLGKRVVNLLPAGAGDKGTALRRLVGLAQATRVLFVGDDVTDEAAFGAELDVPAVMIKVGRSTRTQAGSWLRRRSEVDTLLERLCRLREREPSAGPTGPPPGPVDGLERLGPVLAFMKDLWALEQGLNQRSKAMLGRYGITGPQRLVVRVVGQIGPLTPAQLARVLHLHPSSVTRLIRKLEARSFITRRSHPTHRGMFLLALGSRGGRVERLHAATVESAVRSALQAAGAQDLEATRRVLSLVTARLTRTR